MTDAEDVRFVTRMAEREEEAARWYQHGEIHAEIAAALRRVLARLEAAEADSRRLEEIESWAVEMGPIGAHKWTRGLLLNWPDGQTLRQFLDAARAGEGEGRGA